MIALLQGEGTEVEVTDVFIFCAKHAAEFTKLPKRITLFSAMNCTPREYRILRI